MPLFREICFRGPIVEYLFAIARNSRLGDRNYGQSRRFVYEVQEIRLISPDNFADSCRRE